MDIHVSTKFALGQVVHHQELGCHAVIIDVDPIFLGDGETASTMVRKGEPLDRPWYHVLINGREHVSYVSEASIEPDPSGAPIAHPAVDLFFREFRDDHYVPRRPVN